MSIAITNQVSYNLKPTSVKATRKTITVLASNKTDFSPGDTTTFFLPSLRNHVMDGQSGYLRFTVNAATANSYTDNTAHCFIDRLMTYGAGGQLIDDIAEYGVLANLMTDLQLSQSEKIGLSGLLGTEDDYGSTTATTALTWHAATTAQTWAALSGANPGDAFTTLDATTTPTLTNSNRKGRSLTAASSYTFCISLLHPWFAMSEKYIPVFAMSSDDTRLELTWQTAIKALVGAGTQTYTVSNPEIIVDYIEFDSSVMPLIQQTYAGRDLIFPSQSYHHYASTISATAGSKQAIIPAKQSSCRAFFFAFRPAETQTSAAYTLSSRANPFWAAGDYFNLNVGGAKIPAHPITTRVSGEFSEWYASTQCALHAMNALEMDGSINRTYYNVWEVQNARQVTAASYRNAFALGVNLDSLRGQSTTSNSGVSLSNLTCYWEGYNGTAPKNSGDAAETVTVDAYLLHDVLYVVDANGMVSVRW